MARDIDAILFSFQEVNLPIAPPQEKSRFGELLRVERGLNDLVYTKDNRQFVDLISSTGAVFLGHSNPNINGYIKDQIDKISCSWSSEMDIQFICKKLIEKHAGNNLKVHSLYSTGMEAAEVAMRMAFDKTGRRGLVGFHNNNHGKSIATQNICRKNSYISDIECYHQIPYLPETSEDEILDRLREVLSARTIAAVFVEPIQGKAGGHKASNYFYREVGQLCDEFDTLIVCDEIFTGFYRTGPCFAFPSLEIEPDIVLIGKAIGNGFPVSGVLLGEKFSYHPKDMRFSSTFCDNPLACAAVIGTLREMERIQISDRVSFIESKLASLEGIEHCQIRLYGAFCSIEFSNIDITTRLTQYLFDDGYLTLQREKILGFWPQATIEEEHLDNLISSTQRSAAKLYKPRFFNLGRFSYSPKKKSASPV